MNNIINGLLAERGRHMDSLARLKAASTDWNAVERNRGEATMTNIMSQVLELDAQLQRQGYKAIQLHQGGAV
ncbi:hypothetical protein [Pseudomonas sp. EggHat1]|uniref:hypothetical protein n=1 Tax=Pseudomonas sp. EggHat1 TaxID=2761624 RepID=UPI001866788B|nr:hypothetical protein [Pseudomonas sp. EggHat1]